MTENEILSDVLDFEEMSNETMLILKRNGQRILVKRISDAFREKCYEVVGSQMVTPRKPIKKIGWSPKEKQFLRENSTMDIELLSLILKKSYYQINYMKGKLNLVDRKVWTKEELEYLEENFDKSNSVLAEELKRTIFSIKSKKYALRNKNDNSLS